MAVIRRLPEDTINRIAAGEVVERPASAVKELVENAIDAKARQIDVSLGAGGKSLILVYDDGHGMSAECLALAIERHATSKLPEGDGGTNMFHIASLGFRGEALPSISAVAHLTVTSRLPDGETAHAIEVNGGKLSAVRPAAAQRGSVAARTSPPMRLIK